MAILNQDIAAIFFEMADLLMIRGSDPHRARAFRRAGRIIEGLPESAEKMLRFGTLSATRGVGEGTLRRVKQILRGGDCDDLRRLRASTPPGVRELLQIRGLGPRTVRRLYQELGIANVDLLAVAAASGQLLRLPRFGSDQVYAIQRAIEVYRRQRGKLPLAEAIATAAVFAEALGALPEAQEVRVAGSCRRGKAMIGDLDIVVASENPALFADCLDNLPEVIEVLARRGDGGSVRLASLQQIDVRAVRPACWGAGLHCFTGSKQHNIALRRRGNRHGLRVSERGVYQRSNERCLTTGPSEEELFGALGLPFIPPELREDRGEIEAAAAGRLPRLITAADLRADLHLHTSDSDGTASPAAMIQAAAARGYEYMAITDHSRSLHVANGLDEQRLANQVAKLRRRAEDTGQIHVLAGVEVDILADGTLGLQAEALSRLDWVIASIHSHLDMAGNEMTERLVAAMESGLVDCLGHLSGRWLGKREACALDIERILAVARRLGIALEINGDPRRMDIDDTICRQARRAGVALVINSDAHSPAGLENCRYALTMARRGWLESQHVLNAQPLAEFLAWRNQRRRRASLPAPGLETAGPVVPSKESESASAPPDLVVALGQEPMSPELHSRLERFLRLGDDPELHAALRQLSSNPIQHAFSLVLTGPTPPGD